jgi:predicted RNA-binding protein with PIN domain
VSAGAGASGAEDAQGAAEILADVPRPLWGALLRAVRRAADGLDRAGIPAGLRPYAGWNPERLAGERPRLAVARALAGDPRLREAVGEALEDQAAFEDAAELDATRLAGRHGVEAAMAALAARGRWDDLAVVVAAAADRLAARGRAGFDAAVPAETVEERRERRRQRQELAGMRGERDAQRRRADAAEQRLRSDAGERLRLVERVAALEGEVAELRQQLEQERRRARERIAGFRRRADDAEGRTLADEARALRMAAELESLAAELRGVTAGVTPGKPAPTDNGPAADEPASEAPDAVAGPLWTPPAAVPREVPPAESGRPCRVPAGVGEDDPLAVEALLKVDGLRVIVDGYNVTKDDLGLAGGSLGEQRRWLLGLVAGLAARYRRRCTVVFDGTDALPGLVPVVRGVGVVFTSGGESADQRIVALVEDMPADAPALVVSSDREVRDDSRRLGANTAASRAFLRFAGR